MPNWEVLWNDAVHWLSVEFVQPLIEKFAQIGALIGETPLFALGVSEGVLVQLNGVGITLLGAAVTLGHTSLAKPDFEPKESGKTDINRAKDEARIRSALFIATMWFGACCAVSALLQLLERVNSDCSRVCDTRMLVLATNLTTIGLAWGLILFFRRAGGTFVRLWLVREKATRSGFVPQRRRARA